AVVTYDGAAVGAVDVVKAQGAAVGGAGAAAGDGLIAGEGAVDHGQGGRSSFDMDPTAAGVAEPELAKRKHAAVSADRQIAGERAAADRDVGTITNAVDRAALSPLTALDAGIGSVVEELAAAHRESALLVIRDRSARGSGSVAGRPDSDIVRKHVVSQA